MVNRAHQWLAFLPGCRTERYELRFLFSGKQRMLLACRRHKYRRCLQGVLVGEVQGGCGRLHRTGPRQHHTGRRAAVGGHRRKEQQPVEARFHRRPFQRKVRARAARPPTRKYSFC